MKRIIAIVALIVIGTLSMSAMDAIRIAGLSSAASIKNVTLDVTVRVYDAANTQMWFADITGVHFDNQGVFSFVLNPVGLTYNPVYNVKVENTLGGLIVFESRLDKIVTAQSQYGALVNPSDLDPDATYNFDEVVVQKDLAQVGMKLPESLGILDDDVIFVYDETGAKTFGVSIDGNVFTQGTVDIKNELRVTGNTILGLSGMSLVEIDGDLNVHKNATFSQNVMFDGAVDFGNTVNMHSEVVGDIQNVTVDVAITPTMPILNIGTLTEIKTLINGTPGQIVYVLGDTSTFSLSGVSFSVGATYICTAPNVWKCVGKN